MMKFTCTQENLARGLSIVNRVASKNVALPILNNVLVVAENGSVRLQTTNLELGMSVVVRAKVEEPGSYTVQARALSDFVNFLGNEKITITQKDGGLDVTSGHTKTVIKGLPADDFPVMPPVETSTTVAAPASLWHAVFAGVVFAAANDESRPEISGVYVEIKNKEVIVAATDSYRLSERRLTVIESTTPDQKIIIPARTIQEFLRVAPDHDSLVTLHISAAQIRFLLDDTDIISRVIEGQYPDYHQIIPREWTSRVIIDKTEFISNIRAASLFCQPGVNDLNIQIDPNNKQLIMTAANTQLGEHEAKISAEVEGKEVAIVFNYHYLLDGAQSLVGETIQLDLTNGQAPGVMYGTNQDGGLYLIMPIRQ